MNRDSSSEVRFLRVRHFAVAKPVHVGCLQHNSIDSVTAMDELLTPHSRGRREKELLVMLDRDNAMKAIRMRCGELV
jgi:hypothetical protein